jgi:hypothetical protein
MKKITFRQTMTAFREIEITITDEERFKELTKEWVEEQGVLTLYDLDESHFEGIASIEYGEITDWEDEDNEDFYDQMSENGIQTHED